MTSPSAIPRWLVAGLCAVAALFLAPTLPYVVLALWLGGYATRVYVPLRRVFRGRRGISATVTVLVFVVTMLPLAAMIASLVVDAIALVQQLLESGRAREILVTLATGDTDASERAQETLSSSSRIVQLVMNQGDRAWAIMKQVAGAAAHVLIGLLIFVSGVYGMLTDGRAWYVWVERHAPVDAATTRRFADAFVETGRGLAFGIVGAGLVQSIVATAAYVILDVPAALPLGMITLILSVIPAVGTALVWAPVAVGLAMTGRTEAAIALAVIGVAVVSTVDNLARPYLARRGQLQLPTYVVLIAMFGGVEIIGGWGLILGPLAARLAKEAILVASEARRTLPAPQP
ncbi:MAG: AI-2E family transporter [Kofleriaceae bacterium]|nr:AI-2E family transporter [Kofleriaceae bacterium]